MRQISEEKSETYVEVFHAVLVINMQFVTEDWDWVSDEEVCNVLC